MLPVRHPSRLGVLLAIGGATLFSTKGILIKYTYAEGLSTIAVIALRMAFALPFFVVIAALAYRRKRQKLTRKDLIFIIVCGILSYYVATWLSFHGLHFVSVQLERLILFSYPAIVVLGVAALNREWPHRRLAMATALTYGGIFLVFGQELELARSSTLGASAVAFGAGLVFLSALAYAGYVILSQPLIARLGSPLFTGLSMSVSSGAVMAHVLITTLPTGTLTGFAAAPQAYIYALIIGTLGTVLPALMLSEAVARIGASRTAILSTTGPVATSFLAVSFLNEPFTAYHLSALAFCGIGVAMIVRKR